MSAKTLLDVLCMVSVELGQVSRKFAAAKNGQVSSKFAAAKNGQVRSKIAAAKNGQVSSKFAGRVWYIITPPIGEIEKFCFRPSSSFSIAMTARLKRKKSLTKMFSFFLLGGFGTP